MKQRSDQRAHFIDIFPRFFIFFIAYCFFMAASSAQSGRQPPNIGEVASPTNKTAPMIKNEKKEEKKAHASSEPANGGAFSGFGSGSREPIKIDSDRLEVFDKENRAIYSGNVVAAQGATIVKSATMTILYISAKTGDQPQQKSGFGGQNSIKRIDFEGGVAALSGTQTITGSKMVYDTERDNVTVTGNVVISDCDGVQRGERAVYDMKTGRATVDAGRRGRVQGVFTSKSEDEKTKKTGECAVQNNASPAKPLQNRSNTR